MKTAMQSAHHRTGVGCHCHPQTEGGTESVRISVDFNLLFNTFLNFEFPYNHHEIRLQYREVHYNKQCLFLKALHESL